MSQLLSAKLTSYYNFFSTKFLLKTYEKCDWESLNSLLIYSIIPRSLQLIKNFYPSQDICLFQSYIQNPLKNINNFPNYEPSNNFIHVDNLSTGVKQLFEEYIDLVLSDNFTRSTPYTLSLPLELKNYVEYSRAMIVFHKEYIPVFRKWQSTPLNEVESDILGFNKLTEKYGAVYHHNINYNRLVTINYYEYDHKIFEKKDPIIYELITYIQNLKSKYTKEEKKDKDEKEKKDEREFNEMKKKMEEMKEMKLDIEKQKLLLEQTKKDKENKINKVEKKVEENFNREFEEMKRKMEEMKLDMEKQKSIFEQTLKSESKKEKNDTPRSVSKSLKDSVWREYIGEEYNGSCWCCSRDIDAHNFVAGHVEPWSKGGKTIVENLRPICLPCNSGMKDENMLDYMRKCGFKIKDKVKNGEKKVKKEKKVNNFNNYIIQDPEDPNRIYCTLCESSLALSSKNGHLKTSLHLGLVDGSWIKRGNQFICVKY